MSTENDVETIKGWFAGRVPEGWFEGLEVTLEDDQIVVVGRLPEVDLGAGATAEARAGAAAGRISRFREETRGHRVAIAREAGHRFDKFVTWGASVGDTSERFNKGGSGRGSGSEEAQKVMIGHHPFMRPWRRRTFPSGSWGYWSPWYANPRDARRAPARQAAGSAEPQDKQNF